MAITTKEHGITRFDTGKVEPLPFYRAKGVVCAVIIEQDVKLKVHCGRAVLTMPSTQRQSLCPDGIGGKLTVTKHHRFFHGCALPLRENHRV